MHTFTVVTVLLTIHGNALAFSFSAHSRITPPSYHIRNNNRLFAGGSTTSLAAENDRQDSSREYQNVSSSKSVQPESLDGSSSSSTLISPQRRKRDVLQDALRHLAQLSLADYEWRSDIFLNNEADRRLQQSLSRIMGREDAYVRPMDASDDKIGPLGLAEQQAVSWLSDVMREEGNRARKIVQADGVLVRPVEAAQVEKVGDYDSLGPLARLEKQASDFLNSIRMSEAERVRIGFWQRPKDLDETKRGPLGEAERQIVETLQDIQQSEKLRMQLQSKRQGGEVVRPIDIPGPLGELEMAVVDLVEGEQQRAKQRQEQNGLLVRPKDAKFVTLLGEAERQAVWTVERVTEEERERLRSIQRVLADHRPMENDRNSLLGIVEAFIVGLLRAPSLFMKVLERVQELMSSERLDENDLDIMKRQHQNLDKRKAADDDDGDSVQT